MHPEDAGLTPHPFEAIVGGSPEHNAKEMSDLLDGKASAYRDAVLLNTAAALVVAGKTDNLKEGTVMAAESIDSGSAKAKLAKLAEITSAN